MKRIYCSVVVGLALVASSARADETVPNMVHVDAGSQVVLERVDAHGQAHPVCRAPCDQPVDGGAQYQISGDGLRDSNQFRLAPSSTGRVDVRVTPKSSSSFAVGVVLTTISGVLLTGAIGVSAAAYLPSNGNAIFSGWMMFVAAPLYVGSVATGIPGVMLLAHNIQSRASTAEADRMALSRPSSTTPRAPATVSILSGSF